MFQCFLLPPVARQLLVFGFSPVPTATEKDKQVMFVLLSVGAMHQTHARREYSGVRSLEWKVTAATPRGRARLDLAAIRGFRNVFTRHVAMVSHALQVLLVGAVSLVNPGFRSADIR